MLILPAIRDTDAIRCRCPSHWQGLFSNISGEAMRRSGGRRERNDASAGDQSGQSQRRQGRTRPSGISNPELHHAYPPLMQRADSEAPHCHATAGWVFAR